MQVGDKYAHLTVLEIWPSKRSKRDCIKVVCVCGREKQVQKTALQQGNVKSCGCKKIEMMLTNKNNLSTAKTRMCLRCDRAFVSMHDMRICNRCKMRTT